MDSESKDAEENAVIAQTKSSFDDKLSHRRNRRIKAEQTVHRKSNRLVKLCGIFTIVLVLFSLGVILLKFT